jgi:hypothetical protein
MAKSQISQYRITKCETCFFRLCDIKNSIGNCGGNIWACPQPACAGWGRVLRYSPGTCPTFSTLKPAQPYGQLPGAATAPPHACAAKTQRYA